MIKSVTDIDIKNMDLSPFMIAINSGACFYRAVRKDQHPLIATGVDSRFASEPEGFPGLFVFSDLYTKGQHSSTGTASTCVAYRKDVAVVESTAENKVLYKLTFHGSIYAVDMDLICAAVGIPKPYMTANHSGSWQEFYGKMVQAVHHESFKCKTHYCLNFFPDRIPNFKSLFTIEKVVSPIPQ